MWLFSCEDSNTLKDTSELINDLQIERESQLKDI